MSDESDDQGRSAELSEDAFGEDAFGEDAFGEDAFGEDEFGEDEFAGGGLRRSAIVVMVAVVVLAAALVSLVVSAAGKGEDGQEYLIEIPAGAAERQAAGEDLALIPATLELRVGDTLRIVNHDDSYQTLGPYSIEPNQTLVQRFSRVGEIKGECSLHPSGQVRILITE